MAKSKVFISHSHKDQPAAFKLRDALKQYDIEAKTYESDLSFAGDISGWVKENISKCDCVLVILSDSACESIWVAREIGLALELQKEHKGNHPLIVGVRCDSSDRVFELNVRNFDTCELVSEKYTFSERIRHFNLGDTEAADSAEYLAEQLSPKVTFIDIHNEEHLRLLKDSFECYVQLFPDIGERDDPNDIRIWLEESAPQDSPWKEIYAVLHIGDYVIGMAYITAHLHSIWGFGNYLGVRKCWRQDGRAQIFIEEIMRQLKELLPDLKGVLLEVDPIDWMLLARAAKRNRIGGHRDEKKVLSTLRALRRLLFYQFHKVRAIVGLNGLPLPYWQPAMQMPLTYKNERELILMVRLVDGVYEGDIQLKEIEDMLSFVYDLLYKDAYDAEAGSVKISGYRDYVDTVKLRVMEKAQEGCKLSVIEVPREILRLRYCAQDEGLSEKLSL